MKAVVASFNQEKALAWAFYVIAQLHRLIVFGFAAALIFHLHPCPVQVGVVAVLAPDLRQRAELGVGAGGLHAARTHRGRLLGAELGGARGGQPAGHRPHGRRVQLLQQQHRVVRVRLCLVYCIDIKSYL